MFISLTFSIFLYKIIRCILRNVITSIIVTARSHGFSLSKYCLCLFSILCSIFWVHYYFSLWPYFQCSFIFSGTPLFLICENVTRLVWSSFHQRSMGLSVNLWALNSQVGQDLWDCAEPHPFVVAFTCMDHQGLPSSSSLCRVSAQENTRPPNTTWSNPQPSQVQSSLLALSIFSQPPNPLFASPFFISPLPLLFLLFSPKKPLPVLGVVELSLHWSVSLMAVDWRDSVLPCPLQQVSNAAAPW